MNYANHYGWSDVNPYEVVKKVSDRTLEVRAMDAEKDESVKTTFVPGGFSVVSDNAQAWHIKSNPQNPIVRIRLHKTGEWKDKHGRRFGLSNEPHKFYDYNF
jgi:hypothetical protein